MYDKIDGPQAFRSFLYAYLPGGRQDFPNDPVQNAYLSRQAGPRICRRIARASV